MRRRALVVSNDHIGSSMAGPGIRSYRFAEALLGDFDAVTLAVPFETDLVDDRLEIVVTTLWDPASTLSLVEGYDTVVAQRLPIPTMRALTRRRTRVIYDLYAPLLLEQLALEARERPTRERLVLARLNELTETVALQTGDAFVCASEKQRDFWLGCLGGLGRLRAELYARDPSLRSLIDVVPFGLDVEPPRPGPAMRGVVGGIGDSARILLWPGGVWNWLDPLTVIRAVATLSDRRPDVHLYFLGLRHPNPGVEEMSMAREAVALAEELGVRDRSVHFNVGWVPFGERGRYLLDADLAVSAHFDDVESRFAFRTRLLDCLWAGLPVVTTQGDALGELLVEAGAGRAVGYGDVDAWVETLEELVDDSAARERAAAAAAALRPRFEWPRVVRPLRTLCDPQAAAGGADPGLRIGAEYARLRLRLALDRQGVARASASAALRAAATLRKQISTRVR